MQYQNYSQNYMQTFVGGPVGVSFRDGTGTSGVLCAIRDNTLYLQEYMYQDVFPVKQYQMGTIANVYPFPGCPYTPAPTPQPTPSPIRRCPPDCPYPGPIVY